MAVHEYAGATYDNASQVYTYRDLPVDSLIAFVRAMYSSCSVMGNCMHTHPRQLVLVLGSFGDYGGIMLLHAASEDAYGAL